MRRIGFSFAVMLLLQSVTDSTSAQNAPTTPQPGSAERRSILEALRPPIQKHLGKPFVFEITRIRVLKGWAFLQAYPRKLDGSPLDYGGTPYASAVKEGAFDDGLSALLRKKGRDWQVVTFVVGATDVPWVEWDKEFGVPKQLLPFDDPG